MSDHEKSQSEEEDGGQQMKQLQQIEDNQSGENSEDQNQRDSRDQEEDQDQGGEEYEEEDQDNQDGEEGEEEEEQKVDQSQASEQESDNMQKYLQQEKQILQWCEDNHKLWVDPDFPADNRSLYRDPLNIPEFGKEVRKITWLRPNDIAKDAKFMIDKDGDAKQGAFGESWFIGAIIIVASRSDFIAKLFVDIDHFDTHGFVTFQFFKNGSWKQVVVDTLLPYDPESKQILFTYCANPSEFWIPLMEKAYCKMHGCYENICDGSILEGLVDLTGGVSEGRNDFQKDTVNSLGMKMTDQQYQQLWQTMMSYYHQNFFLGCINFVPNKGTKNADTGTHGILENHHYGICDMREFPKENLKLIKIRNPWGTDGGWNGPYCDDSEEWDRHRQLREELKLVFKNKKSDGTWWMAFSDWYTHFNNLFICKVFPESWDCYSIESKWQGKTNGGICPPKALYQGSDQKPEHLQLDTDDKWFNNPQFRIKIFKETKMYISLMLEDQKLSKQNYVKCDFMVIHNKVKNNRIWERPENQDIVIQANPNENIEAQREITQYITLKRFEGKNFGYYMIIPNLIDKIDSKKDDKRTFFLRVFASNQVEVCEMPETVEKSMDGGWDATNAGGRRRIDQKNNPKWCRNPQYFLNLKQPTHLKIILKKTGNVKKTRNIPIGMTITRALTSSDIYKGQAKQLPGKDQSISNTGKNLARLLSQTKQQLEPPVMDIIERKLQIGYQEKFYESTYSNDDVCALYFYWNPTQGPFCIIPSLQLDEKYSSYKLTIYSNKPVDMVKLDEKRNAALIGQWVQQVSDGGCHLNLNTWQQNPKFTLQFSESKPTKVKITLAIAEKNWKAKTKNTVGGMIGLYLLRREKQGAYLREPNFLPVNVITEEFELEEINQNGYFIMPATYQSGIHGSFILSVTADQEFVLEQLK